MTYCKRQKSLKKQLFFKFKWYKYNHWSYANILVAEDFENQAAIAVAAVAFQEAKPRSKYSTNGNYSPLKYQHLTNY